MPDATVDKFGSREDVQIAVRTQIPLKDFPGITAAVSAQSGQTQEGSALLSEFVIERATEPEGFEKEKIGEWFDHAHKVVRQLFESVVTPELEEKFGPRQMTKT